MPVVFFSTEFHWQLQKYGGRITFASHMSLKSILGVSSLPKEHTKKKASYFSPPFLWDIFVNIQQASTGKPENGPVVN